MYCSADKNNNTNKNDVYYYIPPQVKSLNSSLAFELHNVSNHKVDWQFDHEKIMYRTSATDLRMFADNFPNRLDNYVA